VKNKTRAVKRGKVGDRKGRGIGGKGIEIREGDWTGGGTGREHVTYEGEVRERAKKKRTGTL